MKIYEAKIEENRKEGSSVGARQSLERLAIVGKFVEDVSNWETAQLDFYCAEIRAEFIEGSSSGPKTFTVRTCGESPLQKGDVIHVNVREENRVRREAFH
jgi:hypothetical protein